MEGKWQISIIADDFHTIVVTVPEDCTTVELYDELKKHNNAPRAQRYTLTAIEGELEISGKKRLSDYDIQNKGIVHLMVKAEGGNWPSVDDLEARPRLLTANARIQITTSEKHPDVFAVDFDSPRAIMACGHAVAPLSLALHCFHELEKGEESIKCPACDSRWKFSQIREAACLSADESYEFEHRALFNKMREIKRDVKSCPKCSTFCTRSNNRDKRIVCSNCTSRSGKQYDFCWICLREWKDNHGTEICGNPECGDKKAVYHILANCKLKNLDGIECPSIRACPKCFTIIEHDKKCKHMTCSGCKYEFCFLCLKPYPCETDAWGACDVAPRQAPTKIRPTTIEGDRWLILVRNDMGHIHLIVPADCFVQELFRILYNHPQAPKVCGYMLTTPIGEVVDNSQRNRISEYGIGHNSMLSLVIRLQGG